MARDRRHMEGKGEMEGKCRGDSTATDTLPLERDRWKGGVGG